MGTLVHGKKIKREMKSVTVLLVCLLIAVQTLPLSFEENEEVDLEVRKKVVAPPPKKKKGLELVARKATVVKKKKKGLELEERKAAVVAKTKAQLKAEAAAAAKKKAADDAKAKKLLLLKLPPPKLPPTKPPLQSCRRQSCRSEKTPRSVKTEEVIVRDNGTVVKNKSSTQQKGVKFEGHFF